MLQVQAQQYVIPHLHIGDCYGDVSADSLHGDSFQRKVSSHTPNYTKDYGQM
jgi:hypothetical protein